MLCVLHTIERLEDLLRLADATPTLAVSIRLIFAAEKSSSRAAA